ncbi:MAG: tRNA (adenosine(37)-N6)-dimethylallyltransferase MiaA [Pseudomonadota bacterium]
MVKAQRKIWLIAGPTASGKSAYAMDLAARHQATIINTDSMQVYSQLRLVTARPSAVDEERLPHALYGHVDPAVAYSTAKWVADVAQLLAQIDPAQPLVFVGGTGLYFKALLVGISDMPEVPEAVRRRWRYRLSEEGASKLHRLLRTRDPDAAMRIQPGDGQRIVRALEVLEASGRTISDWQGQRRPLLAQKDGLEKIVLMPDRAVARERIRTRFADIVRDGGVEEVESLLARELDPALPAMKAIGVGIISELLAGRVTVEEALERGVTETAQYAKRQRTWFRNQFDAEWQHVTPS